MRVARRISQAGVDFIKSWEGLYLQPYKDAAGLATIGYGHLIKEGESFDQITEEEAEEILRKDVKWAEDAVNRLVVVKITQPMFDSLTSFVFNVGSGAFEKSTLLQWINRGIVIDAPQQFVRWNKAGGKSLLGLSRRRVAEAAMFLS